jgi:hypothetical protein
MSTLFFPMSIEPDSRTIICLRDRSVIQFCFLLQYSPLQTLGLCKQTYGRDTPSRSQIYKLYAEFGNSRKSLAEKERLGQSKS